MADTNIAGAQIGDMTNKISDIAVSTKTLDSATGQQETSYQNARWTQQLGYYKKIPEVKTGIDMRAIWTLGKGFRTFDSRTQVILDHITGWGRDTFNSILKNMIVTRRINGDAYSEIVRDEKTEMLTNLKPLNPGNMKIITNPKGIIIRYELTTPTQSNQKLVQKFEPDEIFHLVNKRVGDEIHGVSDIDAIEEIIKANNEAFFIQKQVIKHFAKPKMMVEVDEDLPAKVDAFVVKFDNATSKGENLFYPKGKVKPEVLAVPPNATLNILPWREHLKDYFYQVVGIPQIILGSSGEFNESTAKIAYLAFQQSVEDEQLDIEEQVWNQLFLRINLEFPASIQNELISDTRKDGSDQQIGLQASDITSGLGAGT